MPAPRPSAPAIDFPDSRFNPRRRESMEPHEVELLEKYAQNDPELKALWDDHLLYEKQIEKLENKPYRTPTEAQTLKQLKKQKLEGKTKFMAILDKYRV
jgi:uncharacterized protein YdcH (DUF465 family)